MLAVKRFTEKGNTMKNAKRILALVLTLVLSASVFLIPASAASWNYNSAYKQYKGKTYTVFGDSISTGYDPHLTPKLYGMGDGVNPKAFPELVASVTGTRIARYSYDGCRTKDVYSLLGGSVPKDGYYTEFLEKGIFVAMNRPLAKPAAIKKSLKKSSLVTMNIGNNDIFTGPLVMAALDIAQLSEVSSKAAELVEQAVKRGILTKDFQSMFNTLNTLGLTVVFLEAMFAEMGKAMTEMATYLPLVVSTIKANTNGELAIIGMYNPFRSVDTEIAGLKLSEAGDLTVKAINAFLKENAKVLGYTYVNVFGTECYYDTGEFQDTHPTDKGYATMAKKILKTIPHREA